MWSSPHRLQTTKKHANLTRTCHKNTSTAQTTIDNSLSSSEMLLHLFFFLSGGGFLLSAVIPATFLHTALQEFSFNLPSVLLNLLSQFFSFAFSPFALLFLFLSLRSFLLQRHSSSSGTGTSGACLQVPQPSLQVCSCVVRGIWRAWRRHFNNGPHVSWRIFSLALASFFFMANCFQTCRSNLAPLCFVRLLRVGNSVLANCQCPSAVSRLLRSSPAVPSSCFRQSLCVLNRHPEFFLLVLACASSPFR